MQQRGHQFRAVAARVASSALLLFLSLALFDMPKVFAQSSETEFLDYPETALKGTSSASFQKPLDDCRKICLERSGCAGFDHSSATNICRLFTGIDSAQPDPLSTGGTRQRIPGYRDPANSESWYYASFSGVDLWGGDLVDKGLDAPDAGRCSVMCDGQASCRAFSYNQEQNRCFLKSGFDFVQSFSGGSSGLYFKAKTSQSAPTLNTEWELFLMSDFTGNDLNESPANSYKECMQQCGADGQCSGFTWVYYTRPDHCYLKTGTNLYPVRSAAARRGVTSARKYSRTVSPDFVRPVSPRD